MRGPGVSVSDSATLTSMHDWNVCRDGPHMIHDGGPHTGELLPDVSSRPLRVFEEHHMERVIMHHLPAGSLGPIM